MVVPEPLYTLSASLHAGELVAVSGFGKLLVTAG
jgi:hypothetical protein